MDQRRDDSRVGITLTLVQVMTAKVDLTDAEAQLELGVTLCRRAQWRDAIEPLQRAVTLNPDKAAAHYQLGEAYNATDRLTEALDSYEAAVRLQPDHLRAMNRIGVVLDRLGRPEDARAAYQRAREAQKR